MSFEYKNEKWEKVKVLGKGSFGEALLVKRLSDGRHAVCKRVVLSAMKPDERREAANEVQVLAKMKHPNIVEYMGSFEKDDVLHILMEYANAGDIEGLIKSHKKMNQPLPEDVIASLFVQMAHAVRFLHERRILHRDLKAQNVFLSRRRADGPLIVKLGDFGIATVLRNTHALAKTVCGTPYYFSPELCLNKPYNNKTDIWSLGCILYELCTLKHAFDATNMKSLVSRILKGTYEPINQRYSADLGRLIDTMLQQKVQNRLCIQQVLAAPFTKRMTTAMCSKDMMQTIAGGLTKGLKGGPPPAAKSTGSPEPASGPTDKSAALAYGDRAEQARQRRVEMERKEADRRRDAEADSQARHERAERAKQAHQRRASELEKMDDVRKRVELESYDDQQKYVEKGWQVMEEAGQRQDERERATNAREAHLDKLKQQMLEIEAKMKKKPSAPTSAPPAQAIPSGFTKESWEVHQRVMGRDQAPLAPRTDGQVHTQPDQVYGGQKPSKDFDVDAILATHKERKSEQPSQSASDAAQKLWEEQREKIRRAEQPAPAPSVAAAAPAPQAETAGDRALRRPEPIVVVTEWTDVKCTDGPEDEFDDVLYALQTPSLAPEPPEMFEEAPLPMNDITRMEQGAKFTLDGKTLHLQGSSQADPLPVRIESLKAYLSDSLGGGDAFTVLHTALEEIQNSQASDEEADQMLARLERAYGSNAPLVDLMVQLMVCESMAGQ